MKDGMIPEDLLNEIDNAKSVKKVNEKIIESVYKEAVKRDENLSTLKIKIWLLSRKGDWVEAGTWAFSLDKLENIADFIRDIVLPNIENIEEYVIRGQIVVRFKVIDEATGDVKLQNTIQIAVPKEFLKEKKEEKIEEVKEKVESSIWEGLEKFIELNKQVLDTAIKAKEIEKESLLSIFQQQLQLINQKMQELQEKLLKGELKGDDKALAMAMAFIQQLQQLRDEYERKIFELMSKQMEMQQKIQEEKLKHELELQKIKSEETIRVLLEKLEELKPKKQDDEATKITYQLLNRLVEIVLQKAVKEDPLREVKEIAALIKELKDKDTGEDIKEELSHTVIELTKKKLAEDPLQDLATKLKILKEVYQTLEGDKEKVKEELKREIEELKQLLYMQQMNQQQFEIPQEEPKDPLEKLEEESERLARIYARLEKLFGKREPAGKTLLETIKEVLASPTVVKIIEVLGQTLIQAEQLKMQQQAMFMPAYPAYGYIPQQPIPQPQPRVRKKVIRRRIIQQQPISQQQQPIQQIPQQVPQQVPQHPPQYVVAGQPQGNQAQQPTQSANQQHTTPPQGTDANIGELKKEIHETIHGQLLTVIKEWKSSRRKGGVAALKKKLISKIIDIEREKGIIARMFQYGGVNMLMEFKKDVDSVLKEYAGFTQEEADKFTAEVIEEVVNLLAGEMQGDVEKGKR